MTPGVVVIGADTGLKGQIRNANKVEVHGAFEGELHGATLLVHRGGRILGSIDVDTAEVHGELEGHVRVRNLISIRSSGSVVGNVQYGSLAMETGANLIAEVRNVPPTVAGDFMLEVGRGGSVRVTLDDLTALDPDDLPEDLHYAVSRQQGGAIVLADQPTRAANAFTQADLAGGRVLFQHDGGVGREASFEVIVTDAKGSTSGAPRRVAVAVG